MRLTVVGCAGSFPDAASAASCYLLEHDGHRILLDLGSGAFGALQRYADPATLDAVLLSHLHPDHCADLCGCYVYRRYRPQGRLPRLPVRGPDGTAVRAAQMYGLPLVPGMDAAYEFQDHTDDVEIGPFRVRTARVVHPVPAYAIRVDAGGRSLVYSGDTGACQALVDLARGSDLALFEASFLTGQDNPPDLHLTACEAGDHARRAEVPRLVLTHLVAWNDPDDSRTEAATAYDGELLVATAGATYDV